MEITAMTSKDNKQREERVAEGGADQSARINSSSETEARFRRDNPHLFKEKRTSEDGRFKPGQSGNPSGRPRGAVSMRTKLRRELRKKTMVTKNGRSARMPKGDVIVTQLVDNAMRDVKTAALVFRWIGEDEPVADAAASTKSVDIPKLDREVLRRILRRAQRLEDDLE
jgi:hypothetical protein